MNRPTAVNLVHVQKPVFLMTGFSILICSKKIKNKGSNKTDTYSAPCTLFISDFFALTSKFLISCCFSYISYNLGLSRRFFLRWSSSAGILTRCRLEFFIYSKEKLDIYQWCGELAFNKQVFLNAVTARKEKKRAEKSSKTRSPLSEDIRKSRKSEF